MVIFLKFTRFFIIFLFSIITLEKISLPMLVNAKNNPSLSRFNKTSFFSPLKKTTQKNVKTYSIQEQNKLLRDISRTTENIFFLEELHQQLKTKKTLTIQLRADLKEPSLHLGHAVHLWMMRRFQEDGHKIILLLEDFKPRIRDLIGSPHTTIHLDQKEIKKNSHLLMTQINKILITNDPKVFEIRRNSEWFSKMTKKQFMSMLLFTTHDEFISKIHFQKNLTQHKAIELYAFISLILQSYDAYQIGSDIHMVFSDQSLLNEMRVKHYQEKLGKPTQIIIFSKISHDLTESLQQQKNLRYMITITDSPKVMYTKSMSIKNDTIIDWMKYYTVIAMTEIEEYKKALDTKSIHPIGIKCILAKAIVARYHGETFAEQEHQWFLKEMSKKKIFNTSDFFNDKGGKNFFLKITQAIRHITIIYFKLFF